jgi:hypothetical protein
MRNAVFDMADEKREMPEAGRSFAGSLHKPCAREFSASSHDE